jgi:uncharacterized protein DUF6916
VRDLANLTMDDFAALQGAGFRIGDPPSEATLVEVTEIDREPGGRAPFSLVFQGGPAQTLPQGTHRVEHPELGPIDVFLVPIGPDRYQAVFT